MPLTTIWINKSKLRSHGNWNEPIKQLLWELEQSGTAVLDVSSGWPEKDPGNSLVIADCEEDLRQAKKRRMAVLGYQPGEVSRIQSHTDMLVEGFEEVDFRFLERVYQRCHNLPWTILETPRCIVREMTVEDLDALYELYRPEEITRYMEGLRKDPREEKEYSAAYIESMYRFYGYGLWLVTEKNTGRIIGRAGLDHLELEGEILPQLGYLIAREKQNQGYASEVCSKVLEYAGEELGFSSVYCMIQKENRASVHLAKKLGFHLDKEVQYQGQEMYLYQYKISTK